MGDAAEPWPVNLVCPVLAARTEWLDAARRRLEQEFGPVELASGVWPFDFTHYYEAEMGTPLLRTIYCFHNLIAPDELPAVKLATNAMERELAAELPEAPPRPVNLDPGYVDLARLVLATTKDYGHRLYLGQGIYGECTLRWRHGGFEPWPWTYADYATDQYRAFFTRVRWLYKRKLDTLLGQPPA